MMTLTQYLSDLPGRKDGEKVGDARTHCERCQLTFVELANLRNGHVQLLSQGFDRSPVRITVARSVDEESLYIGHFLKVRMFSCYKRRDDGDKASAKSQALPVTAHAVMLGHERF
jgi:hypothetical protein